MATAGAAGRQHFSAAQMLDAWEQIRPLPQAARRVTLVQVFGIDAAASIGAQDEALLHAYTANFSSTMDGVSRCPECGTEVELSVPVAELCAAMPIATPIEPLVHGGQRIVWRLPDGHDFAAAAARPDAAAFLMAQCAPQAPGELREELSSRIAAADPYADISFTLVCPQCEHGWESLLDPAEFVLTQLRARAQRLVSEVDALARAYGWSETEILALSQARRDSYLEMVYG